MKGIMPSLLIALLAVICVTCGYTTLSNKNVICEQKYALCSSASCVPDPKDPSKAVCFCNVLQGQSYGQTSCDKRKAYSGKNGLHFVTSTYSFDDTSTKRMMTCPKGNPWTNCLDKLCTVDPMNPTKAICQCDVSYEKEFITWGGNCDTSTCSTGYWSGATIDSNKVAMAFFAKATGKESPQKYCQ